MQPRSGTKEDKGRELVTVRCVDFNRINEGRIMMMVLIIPVIHTNAFLKDKLYFLPTDTLAEMNKF